MGAAGLANHPPFANAAPFPGIPRRTVLLGLCCLCGAAPAPTSYSEVADGIFLRNGLDEDATRTDADAIANIGFIVGDRSVAVFDPGGSRADGEALRSAIRARTDKPVSHVIMSHVHPDHVFGAGAFSEDRLAFVGHAKLPAALARRGEYYRKGLAALYGEGGAGAVVVPDTLVATTTTIDLGGRVITLAAHPPAHTDADLTAFDERTGTFLLGDLLFVGRIPSLDGSLRGWIRLLDTLAAVRAARAVPGHGPVTVAWPDALAAQRRYLETLAHDTRALISGNVDIADVSGRVAQGERGNWTLFDDYNDRNATAAYKELEWE